MINDKKPEKKSIEEIAAAMPPGTIRTIDPTELTKDEWHQLVAGTEEEHLLRLAKGSPRELAIIGAGYVDDALRGLLRAFFVEAQTKKLLDRLLEPLQAKVAVAFAAGLISDEERARAVNVAKIRNRFAHDPRLHTFEHDQDVMDAMGGLRLKGNAPAQIPSSLVFATAIAGLRMAFAARHEEAARQRRTQRPNA